MRNIDLESLRFFKAVAESGSVSHAAIQLSRVPSNVSTRVKQLEQRLGVDLFKRTSGKFALTVEGEKLLVYADKLIQLAIEAELAVTRSQPSGKIRLGALESCTAGRLPPILANFHQLYPYVSLELTTGNTDELVRDLQIGKLDAAIIAEPFEIRGVESCPIFVEELVLIGAKEYQGQAIETLMEDSHLIVFPEGCSYRKQLESWLTPTVFSQKATWEVRSYHAIIACVAAGSGCAIVPRSVLEASGYGEQVSTHALNGSYKHNTTHFIYSSQQNSPQISALLSTLQQSA